MLEWILVVVVYDVFNMPFVGAIYEFAEHPGEDNIEGMMNEAPLDWETPNIVAVLSHKHRTIKTWTRDIHGEN